MNDPPASVITALAALLGSEVDLEPAGEPEPWSDSWKVRSHGPTVYVKRTPRTRPESLVVSALAALVPGAVPPVLAGDLDPGSPTRWFVLGDAGDCDRSPLTLDGARNAARLAGALQRRSQGEEGLAHLLPGCRARDLHHLAIQCCRWAQAGEWSLTDRGFLRAADSRLAAATAAARGVATALGDLPPTVVHGDLWSGNIARAGGDIRFVDWGDAFWGVGSVDVVNLAVARPTPFDAQGAAAIWAAYEDGRQAAVDEEARRASVVAHTVASLAGDRRIAESIGRPPQWLRGIVPGLRGLLAELDAWQ